MAETLAQAPPDTVANAQPTRVVRHPSRDNSGDAPFTDVLGLRVSAIDMGAAVATIEGWIADDMRQYVCICTVHGVVEGMRDPALLAVLNEAGLRTPDGMPLVWLSRAAGNRTVNRVYGPDLMLELCARSARTGHRHFFYGGMPGVADDLVSRLSARFPGLKVVGAISPPLLPTGALEDESTIRAIDDAKPDIVWIGLSTPKQDWWMANHRPLLDAPVLIGVGAAFDFHSGRVRQAPVWMQRSGMEWFFRLTQDPRRLWKRYTVVNSRFLVALVSARMKRFLRP